MNQTTQIDRPTSNAKSFRGKIFHAPATIKLENQNEEMLNVETTTFTRE